MKALDIATLNISIITNLYLNKNYIENIKLFLIMFLLNGTQEYIEL